MARILYGISGQGYGHAARSGEVIGHLRAHGHEVLVMTYGQGPALLAGRAPVYEIPGLRLRYRNNRLVYLPTLAANVAHIAQHTRSWLPISRAAQDFRPDLVMTDFEPITALLAKLNRWPLISLDNQHQMTRTRLTIPAGYRAEYLADRIIIRSFIWRAEQYIITSFFNSPITHARTSIIPPIIRAQVRNLKPQEGNYFLVYLTSPADSVLTALKRSSHQFIVYGSGHTGTDGTIAYKETSTDGWLTDLAGARAVVGTAGASLISEALYLGKPYLALPVAHQIEQIINALALERLGYGLMAERLTDQVLDQFDQNLARYDERLASYVRPTAVEVFGHIDATIERVLR